MKLLTLNTHSLIEPAYEAKRDAFVEFIRKEQPDVFALQEVNQTAAAPLLADVPAGYYPCPGNMVLLKADNHAAAVARMLEERGVHYHWSWLPAKIGYDRYDDDEYDVITSGCSAAATASVSNTTIGKTKITSGKSSKGKVNLKWQKVNGAAGYVVYRSTKKGSRYTKIAEITKGSTVKYTDKTAKKGKKYYYKVRAVKANEAGVDVFSAYSAAKAVKVK